jgi:hypothetical protein
VVDVSESISTIEFILIGGKKREKEKEKGYHGHRQN